MSPALGLRSYWRRRVARHFVIAAGSVAAGFAVGELFASRPWMFRLSVATAYVATALLVLTLLLGPLNVVRARANPVSTDLRRDLGIWAGIIGVLHTVVGLQRHFRGRMWQYFIFPEDMGRRIPIRYDAFGVANWTGLAATLILVALLALSNDWSLRRLGTRRWKAFQRWNYAGFVLVIAHGLVYQASGDRPFPYVAVTAGATLVTIAVQVAGYRTLRATARPASRG
jgi:sulfoxide reductase heme-binding subunit YedZ